MSSMALFLHTALIELLIFVSSCEAHEPLVSAILISISEQYQSISRRGPKARPVLVDSACEMLGHLFDIYILGQGTIYVELSTLLHYLGTEVDDLDDAAGKTESGKRIHCSSRVAVV